MLQCIKIIVASLVLVAVLIAVPAAAKPSENRLALVIGNASYQSNKLATTINDAALVAETLKAAGFDVMGARDLDQDLLRQAFQDFIGAVAKAGPDAVAAVYYAGYGVQFEGENYLLPVDANIAEKADVPGSAVRLSEQLHALGGLHLKATFVMLDMAQKSLPLSSGRVLAGGLALIEPEPNMLIALNASPGTVSGDDRDGYGCYAKALAEMILEGGRTPASVFDRVRLRVNESTKGAQVPWDASRIETQFSFLERSSEAPVREDAYERTIAKRSQSMRSLDVNDAYWMTLARDTFDGYTDFLADFWREPRIKQIQALLAIRREAITWRRTYQANAPDAYWSYLERYAHGPHVADAKRLLANLGAAAAPPSRFARMEYDVPPPLPDELPYIERTVLDLNDPSLGLDPPQQPPAYILGPPPKFVSSLPLPTVPSEAHVLPALVFSSLPRYLRIPADVLVPPGSTISADRHNILVVGGPSDALTGQATSSNSRLEPSNLDDRPRLPPSVASGAARLKSQTELVSVPNPTEQVVQVVRSPPSPSKAPMPRPPFWATLDPVARDGVTPSLGNVASIVPFTPSWAADYGTQFDADAGLAPLAKPADPPIAPALTVPVLSSRLNRRASSRQPLTTGSIPTPPPRPATFAAQTSLKRPKPIARAISASSSIAVDLAAAPSPRSGDRIPVAHLPRPPKAAPGIIPPKPERKPCLLIWKLMCS